MTGKLSGEVRITKKRNMEDTRKKCSKVSDKKLLYFCDPRNMKKYKDFGKTRLTMPE
jgi:hypothetical protein